MIAEPAERCPRSAGCGRWRPRRPKAAATPLLGACAAYLYGAIRTVYAEAGAARILKAGVLALYAAALVLGYRFLIFLITLIAT